MNRAERRSAANRKVTCDLCGGRLALRNAVLVLNRPVHRACRERGIAYLRSVVSPPAAAAPAPTTEPSPQS